MMKIEDMGHRKMKDLMRPVVPKELDSRSNVSNRRDRRRSNDMATCSAISWAARRRRGGGSGYTTQAAL